MDSSASQHRSLGWLSEQRQTSLHLLAIVAINPPPGKWTLLGAGSSKSRTLLWHVFNRRLRALGYLRENREINLIGAPMQDAQLCNPAKEELLFYVRRLATSEDKAAPDSID